jgi:hypothetical protein
VDQDMVPGPKPKVLSFEAVEEILNYLKINNPLPQALVLKGNIYLLRTVSPSESVKILSPGADVVVTYELLAAPGPALLMTGHMNGRSLVITGVSYAGS